MMKKIIAFGDIHGCFKAAATAVKLAESLNINAVFLGDYVDRGPSAVKTLQILMQAKAKHPEWVFLRGNHDQMLLDLINQEATVTEIGTVLNTMKFDYKQAAASYEEWKALAPNEQANILNFLNSTTFYFENKKYIFTHGVVNMYGGSINQKSKELLMWNYDYNPKWYGKMFIHGHSPEKFPAIRHNGINVNTACGYGGYLTGVITNTTNDLLEFHSITEEGDILQEFKIYSDQYVMDYPLLITLDENTNKQLEIYPINYETLLDWHEAKAECLKLEGGWRLPTVNEMELIYEQLYVHSKGLFKQEKYWCSNEDNSEESLFFAFYASGGYDALPKNEKLNFRPVREYSF